MNVNVLIAVFCCIFFQKIKNFHCNCQFFENRRRIISFDATARYISVRINQLHFQNFCPVQK